MLQERGGKMNSHPNLEPFHAGTGSKVTITKLDLQVQLT